MAKQIVRKVEKLIESCDKCYGSYHIGSPPNRVRCVCFRHVKFVANYKASKAVDDHVDYDISKQIRQLFVGNLTVVKVDPSSAVRVRWMHSSAYCMCKLGYSTRIYSDGDIIHEKLDSETRNIYKFIEPEFLSLELGIIRNKDYIGGWILNILRKREEQRKRTLIVIPFPDSIRNRYEDKNLESFINTEIHKRGAYHGPHPKDKITK